MEKRPKIRIEPTAIDKMVEAFGYLLLGGLWIMNILSYSSLPETIPIHYNGLGEPDNYGPKSSLFLLPIIGTMLFIFLSVLAKFPQKFNYMVEITPENAEKQYANATRMMRFLKIVIIILFAAIDFSTIQTAKGNADGLGKWFLPFVLGLIFIPMTYFAYRSHKLKN